MSHPLPPPTTSAASDAFGSIIDIGHINLHVPSQATALAFYVDALGLTRDPDAMTGSGNTWINCGSSQFHLPCRSPTQLHRGVVGLVVGSLDALLLRLSAARAALQGTQFDFAQADDHVQVTCPWGNRLRCHAPQPQLLGGVALGMAYVEFDVAVGTCEGIGLFYKEVIGAAAAAGDACVRVCCGAHQMLVFRECSTPLAPYDGYHVMLTLDDFPGVFSRLADLQLITKGSVAQQECAPPRTKTFFLPSNQHLSSMYRFTDIVHPLHRRLLLQVEHELRSVQHPQHARALVNAGAAAAHV